ncbi:MAG: hypothetical protein HGA72_01525 [Chlorobiaceae bacterium]|jgi:hypothetical protein|nr:hypothetical protein [Chlorobiaceae bacterium]NTW62665.1 hypothetical protein [Chlorobiaceae bacterium]
MGKRQIIYRPAQISGNQNLLNLEINLVTRESRVWHGKITSVSSSGVELKDARGGKHAFSIEQVDRIYRDIKTDY